jgi:hypothetical protein
MLLKPNIAAKHLAEIRFDGQMYKHLFEKVKVYFLE